jgi:hypothetical protein
MAPEIVRLTIPSRSRPGLMHEVTLTAAPQGLDTRCSCEAATFRPFEACWHVGRALALAGIEGAVAHPLPVDGELVGGQSAKVRLATPERVVSPEEGKRARMAARRPAMGERAPRESAGLIRARVDLAALRAVQVAAEQGVELGPLEASTFERAEAIEAEARKHGLLPAEPEPVQTTLDEAPKSPDSGAPRPQETISGPPEGSGRPAPLLTPEAVRAWRDGAATRRAYLARVAEARDGGLDPEPPTPEERAALDAVWAVYGA